jgi:hypothetical protein
MLVLEQSPPKIKLDVNADRGRPHGSPLLMAIETNGGRTGKFGVIFLLFAEDAQAAWDSSEHLYNHQEHLDDTI